MSDHDQNKLSSTTIFKTSKSGTSWHQVHHVDSLSACASLGFLWCIGVPKQQARNCLESASSLGCFIYHHLSVCSTHDFSMRVIAGFWLSWCGIRYSTEKDEWLLSAPGWGNLSEVTMISGIKGDNFGGQLGSNWCGRTWFFSVRKASKWIN